MSRTTLHPTIPSVRIDTTVLASERQILQQLACENERTLAQEFRLALRRHIARAQAERERAAEAM